MTRLRLATLNIYFHPHNRWVEREPLIREGIRRSAPDVLALQEVDRAKDADHVLADGRYAVCRAREQQRLRYPRHWDGLSLLYEPTRIELRSHDVLPLTHHRIVQRVQFGLADGSTVLVANTHLHHTGPAVRNRQTARVITWLAELPADSTILLGDLNGGPHEPLYDRLQASDYVSAYAAVHGREPARTFPSGLVSGGGTPEPDESIDYIWLQRAVALDAQLAWDGPAPDDATLYPSDHLGVVADVEVG